MTPPDPALSVIDGEEQPGPDAFLRRADGLADFDRREDAVAELQRGLGEFPDSVALWSSLVWRLYQCDRDDEARQAAERALGLSPDDLAALITSAALAVDERDAPRAHFFADRVLALAPELPTAHLVKAQAYAAEPRGAAMHREVIRLAAYYAVGLAPEDPAILRLAAGVLQPVAGQQEVAALVDRGLAISPQDEGLRVLSAEVHAKGDVDSVRRWTSVLAQNPKRRDLVLGVEVFVWERTRLVGALALWLIPALVATAALAVIPLIVLAVALRNLWDLLIATRRDMPRGLLKRVWGEPAWARIGVACVFVGASWPLLTAPIILIGQPWLLVPLVLVLGAGETLTVLASQLNERRHLLRLGHAHALELVEDFRGRARLGWLRISVAAIVLLVVVGMSLDPDPPPYAEVIVPLLLVLALGLAVPPILVMRFYRRMRRELCESREPRGAVNGDAAGDPAPPARR